ncbi:MAG TPA: Uma2 family endonuclease [Bryobacteraceae bacterium]|nr:Uma2 family endonuclease [Bryobacteraceae bacterium]
MLKTLVPVEEYLARDYSPDVDYVDGTLEDRHVGEKDHSKLQFRIQLLLSAIAGIHIFPEVRIKVAPTRFRVPDAAVYYEEPDELVFTAPPSLVIEILSPEDRMSRMMVRVQDYLNMGVENLWLIDPAQRETYTCNPSGMHKVTGAIETQDRKISLSLDAVFDRL